MLSWRGFARRLLFAAILICGAAACIEAIALFSSSYKSCVANEDGRQTSEKEHGTLSSIGVLVRCEAVPLNKNSGALTAVGTFIVALFTLTLWLASDKQGRLTEKIARTSERQTEAAIAAASPRLYFIASKLARYDGPEGAKLEDPISGSPYGYLRPLVCVQNGGNAGMPVTGICFDWSVSAELPVRPAYRHIVGTTWLIAKDEPIWLYDPTAGFELNETQIGDVQHGRAHLWFYGFVAYRNQIGDTIEHGFVFRWNSLSASFEPGGPQKYTYEKRTNADLS